MLPSGVAIPRRARFEKFTRALLAIQKEAHLSRRMRISSPSSACFGALQFPPAPSSAAAAASRCALVRARVVRWKGTKVGSVPSTQRP